jgi:SPP1 gp7 family putative phage head morphogenesis protein
MPNQLKLDPTRTTTLRNTYSADMKRRFNKVKKLTVIAIGELDVLGLTDSEPPFTFNELITNELPARQAWRFQTNDQKLKSFNNWFSEQVDAEILTVDVKGDPWTAKYVNSSYKKGSFNAYTDVHKEALAEQQDFYKGSRAQFLDSAFNTPERLSKLQFLYTRSFEDLKGITNAMSLDISRTLADGMAQGKGARAIARDLSRNITTITNKRALVMARTEVIAVHAEGQLDSFEELGVKEVGLMAEWSTAGDDRVCALCVDLDGVVMTIEEARGLIPRHPNCRCSWMPANVGEKDKKRFWTKAQKEEQIGKSLLAELPKKTRGGQKVEQTIREAKRRSTWSGKELKVQVPPKGVHLNK